MHRRIKAFIRIGSYGVIGSWKSARQEGSAEQERQEGVGGTGIKQVRQEGVGGTAVKGSQELGLLCG